MDFCVVRSVGFKALYVFVVIEHGRRKIRRIAPRPTLRSLAGLSRTPPRIFSVSRPPFEFRLARVSTSAGLRSLVGGSGEDGVHDVAVDISQSKAPSLVFECQLLVIDPE